MEIKSEELLKSVNEKFDLLKELTSAVATGGIQALVVRGAAGIGKSHTITEHLRMNFVRGCKNPIRIKITSGHITPLQTFKTLKSCSDDKSVVIFDDCDSVFTEINSLNILKAACDTKKFRTVSWNSSKVDEDVFDFQGGIILISNADFRSTHYQAFIDRVHLYDMKVTQEEKIARIQDIATKMGDVKKETAKEICDWLFENKVFIGYLSFRTFYKIAQLAKMSKNWKKLAEVTVFGSLDSLTKEMYDGKDR